MTLSPAHLWRTENAKKAWRRFFRSVEPAAFDPEGSRLYGMLQRYVALVRRDHADPQDSDAICTFVDQFAQVLTELATAAERHSKLRELRELIENLQCGVTLGAASHAHGADVWKR